MSGRWMPARTTRPNEVLCSSSQTPSSTTATTAEQQQPIAREQEVAEDDRAFQRRGGIDADSGAAPQMMRISCSATMARPKVTSRLRIGSAV